jgi:ATP-dependent DNA helicase RecQ
MVVDPHHILQRYWGFKAFRPMQEDIVRSVLDGHDTLALLPTGGGKSICFQVPAMCQPGLCIVVSPLIALMRDQVQNLQLRGIKAIAIHTGISAREIDRLLDSAVFGEVKFLYVSPERLASDDFKARVPKMGVSLIAIDEAHCISQWGYDFRPSYLKVATLRDLLPGVPVIALTATATPPVVTDIQEKLQFRQGHLFQKSFVRSNLSYVVRHAEDKNLQLIDILKKVRGTAIVYVRNRRRTKEIADYLTRNGISATFYHAGLDNDERNKRQTLWLNNKIRVMVCTNAFGMGIDKPDVRMVVHIEPADSLEAYFQEAGRAGRDEQKAYAVQLTSGADQQALHESRTLHYPTFTELKDIYDKVCSDLGIAYHSGMGIPHDFDLPVFAKKYSYSPTKVMNGFKLLESQNLLFANEGIQAPPKIKVIVGKDVLYKFQVEHRQYEPLIKMLLRTCSGIFEDHVAFDENAIGFRLKMSREETMTMLQNLDRLDIFSYYPRKEKPQMILTQDRIKKEDLILDKKFIDERINGYQDRIDNVLRYLTNDTICRSRMLVHYFGEEDAADCGVCDICLSRKKSSLSTDEFAALSERISALLASPQTLQSISESLSIHIDRTKTVIDWLADHGKISRTEDGRISLKA